ncbi:MULTISPECIES: hypothetical protein [unclassified Pseudovibrio]|uniref:hypothetical protein n=1 Tax=unclassified Pseudovibrio TaxID=2627060 RepID=UPI0007AE4531|nr:MULTISPECIES: hypothetical protein [unclassified Pseudovibrio]KZL01483.1 hypothetical protein PsW74_01820 [Pseudovibrio sp. W74]KZL05804.1 hypothetical protein PsAD14_04698 [Pseudovibrio sp. Ad14]
MFGGFRKKMTRQTIEMVKQPYAIFQHHHGIPAGFWQDEFVVGFFGSMVSMVAMILAKGKLSRTDRGYVLQDSFSALSNMNGMAIAQRFTELSMQKPMSASFKQGVDNGAIISFAMFGTTAPEDQMLIDAAEQEAARLGLPLPSYLMMTLYVEELKERFDLS